MILETPRLLFSIVISVVVCALSIVLLSGKALSWALVDTPGGRRLHDSPTPLVGGIAMMAGLFLGVLIAGLNPPSFSAYVVGVLILLIVGVQDDRAELSTGVKALSQVVAAGILVVAGDVRITEMGNLLGFGDIHLGFLSVPFTIFAIVGLVNAMNMIDGMDGLAGLISVVIFFTIIFYALSARVDWIVVFATLFVSVLVTFLCFNMAYGRRHAKVFMGDAGSMAIGYTLAWFLIVLSQPSVQTVRPMAVLWILAVPVLDTLRLMAIRLIERESIFKADNRHMHHLLRRQGRSYNTIVAIMVSASALCAIIAFVIQTTGLPDAVLFYGYAVLFFVMLFLFRKI